MSHPLDGCRAKIERAKEHVRNLNAEITALTSGNLYSVVGENQPERQRYIFRCVGPPVPLRIAVIAGEVVHHLRSSLDHVVWALAERNNVAADARIQFPVCDSRQKFERAVKTGIMKGVSRNCHPVIERLQPYHSPEPPNHVIKLVHDLNVHDKHRLLVVTAVAMRFGPVIDIDAGGANATVHFPPANSGSPMHRGIENGEEVQWVAYTVDGDASNFKAKNDFTVHVAFDEIGASKRPEVIPTLTQLCDYIEAIVRHLEDKLF